MPSGLEVWSNCATCVIGSDGYAGSGTSDAPAAGTSESWTMGTGYTSFPTASTSSVPNTFFYIRDPADTGNEIVLVTAGGGGTDAWTVTRGVNGSTTTHQAGATWEQVIGPYTLENLKQASNAYAGTVTVSDSSTETLITSYTPGYSSEIQAGSMFDLEVNGKLGITSNVIPTLQWTLYSGGTAVSPGSAYSSPGTVLCQMITGATTTTVACPPLAATTSSTTVTAGAASSYRLYGVAFSLTGLITWISTTEAVASLDFNWVIPGSGSADTPTVAFIGAAQSNGLITGLTATNPMVLTVKWTTTTTATSNVVTCYGPSLFREA